MCDSAGLVYAGSTVVLLAQADIDLRGFPGLEPDVPKCYTSIRMNFRVNTDEENLGRLRKPAEFSRAYNTLIDGVKVDIDIQPK
ncbi:MAG: hypothetical protein H0T88_09620 [Lysobacter sp.]|nr:hypothetical protein [Lysobacter sp.]